MNARTKSKWRGSTSAPVKVTSLKGVVLVLHRGMGKKEQGLYWFHREYPDIKTKGELVARVQEEWVSGNKWRGVDLGIAIELALNAYAGYLA